MTPDSDVSECVELKIKSKIGKIFVNKKILEEYCVSIYEIDPYFYEHYERKVDENGHDYILFRTDVDFIEYNLAVEADEKEHVDSDLFFEKKDTKRQKKILDVILLDLILVKKIKTQTMKLVEYKHLLVGLKTKNNRTGRKMKKKKKKN